MHKRYFCLGLGFVLATTFTLSCQQGKEEIEATKTPSPVGEATAEEMSNSDQKQPPQTSPNPADKLLALIKGQPVTENQLNTDLSGREKSDLIRARIEYYEAERNALEAYLFERLLKEEAKQKGVSRDEIYKHEIENKVKKVSKHDVEKFYDEIKSRNDQGGRKAPPLNDRLSDRIREKLEQDVITERKDLYFEKLKQRYNVQYKLEKPRMEVAFGSNPVKGKNTAPITIVEFSDFECPFCKRGADTIEQVMKKYAGKVKLYFRDFPLAFHKRAQPAALAARCAGEQGKFWEFHDQLWEKRKFEDKDLLETAKSLKLKSKPFEECLKDTKHLASLNVDMNAATNLGVTGTPAFFINGIPLMGAQPLERFVEVIEEELKAIK